MVLPLAYLFGAAFLTKKPRQVDWLRDTDMVNPF
jgi:hypothetical protein